MTPYAAMSRHPYVCMCTFCVGLSSLVLEIVCTGHIRLVGIVIKWIAEPIMIFPMCMGWSQECVCVYKRNYSGCVLCLVSIQPWLVVPRFHLWRLVSKLPGAFHRGITYFFQLLTVFGAPTEDLVCEYLTAYMWQVKFPGDYFDWHRQYNCRLLCAYRG